MTLTRRKFISHSGAAGALLAVPNISFGNQRPVVTHGLQSGDINTNSGVIWARCDRPAKAYVELATNNSFENAIRLAPTNVLQANDFAMKRLLTNLPAGEEIFYRVTFETLDHRFAQSEPMVGHFRTAPASSRDVRFAWSGDTAG